MSYYLEKTDIDFGITPIDNIFINEYMPYADGNYVKVYLMGYKFANFNNTENVINNENLAKILNLPLLEVLKAWEYWENQHIIKRHIEDNEINYAVEYYNLKYLYLNKEHRQTDNTITQDNDYVSNEQLIVAGKSEEFNNMFVEIEHIYGKFIAISEKRKIIQWTRQYNMPPEMIIQAFSYSINNKKKRGMATIEKVVATWDREGVTDLDKLAEFLEKKEYKYSVYSRVCKALGFVSRALTEAEMKIVDKWVDEYKYSTEIILEALEKSAGTTNPNLKYFDAIITRWHQAGYTTLEQVKNDSQPGANKKQDKGGTEKKTTATKNKFHNFEQRDDGYTNEELEELSRRKFEEKLKKFNIAPPGKNN